MEAKDPGTRRGTVGGREAGAGSVPHNCSPQPPLPVLSAVCEWHLTSRLFSPHALDSSPDNPVRLVCC